MDQWFIREHDIAMAKSYASTVDREFDQFAEKRASMDRSRRDGMTIVRVACCVIALAVVAWTWWYGVWPR